MLPILPNQPFQAAFAPLLHDLVPRVCALLGAQLDSLYVYGSVARGLARPGHSDLDLTLVVTAPLSAEQTQQLELLGQQLQGEHPVVSKIDWDIGVRADVLRPEHANSWGYWLKHECRCLAGEDLGARFAPFVPSRAIARALNGDYAVTLAQYQQRMAEASTQQALRRLQKEAARKLLRASHVLRVDTDTDWPTCLDDYAQALCRRYPDKADAAAFFLRQATLPDAERDHFNAQLVSFVQWLQQTERALAK